MENDQYILGSQYSKKKKQKTKTKTKTKPKQTNQTNKPKKTKVSNFKGCIYVIHQPAGPYWEKLCPRFWNSAQDRGHSISLYGRT